MIKILCLVLAGVIIIALLPEDSGFFAASQFPVYAPLHPRWHEIIDFTFNTWTIWPNDLMGSIASALNGDNPLPTLAKCHLIILFVGLFLVLRNKACQTSIPFHAFISAFGVTILLSCFYGFDQLIIPSLSFFPWLVLSVMAFLEEGKAWPPTHISESAGAKHRDTSTLRMLCLTVTAALISIESGFYSLPLVALGLLIGYLLGPSQKPLSKIQCFAFIVAILCPLIALLHTPTTPFPNYPPDAHLVPDDGIPGIIRPLIGPDTPIPVMDRSAIKATYGRFSAILLFFSLALLLLFREKRVRLLSITAVSLALFCWIDTRLTEPFSQIGPLASLSRIVPGLFMIPLTPLALALCLFVMSLILFLASSWKFTVNFLLILVILGVFHKWNIEDFQTLPFLRDNRYLTATSQALSSIPAQNAKISKAAILSPSLYLVREVGESSLENQVKYASATFHDLRKSDVVLSASHNNTQESLAVIIDKDRYKNRWSPLKGMQTGDEWLHAAFKNTKSLDGIILSSGAYVADFPRGVRISIAKNCKDTFSMTDKKDYQVVVDYPSWQGEIKFTESGFPYFAGQDKVKIFFPQAVLARCLLIEQTAESPSYDWSVTGISLLEEAP